MASGHATSRSLCNARFVRNVYQILTINPTPLKDEKEFMSLRKMFYTCRNEDCEHEWELEIEYTNPVPAYISGPPEICYPAEGGDFDIISDPVCPKCAVTVDLEYAQEKFWDTLADSQSRDYDE